MDFLENYFGLKEHNTTVQTELRAGLATFLTMAYILALNPMILSAGGFDQGSVFVATVLSAALACLIMAFYGKTWPVGLAPGMGLNAFVAFGVCGTMGHSPQEALGAVLVAGILFLIISVTPIRAWIINSIPKSFAVPIDHVEKTTGIDFFYTVPDEVENELEASIDLEKWGFKPHRD